MVMMLIVVKNCLLYPSNNAPISMKSHIVSALLYVYFVVRHSIAAGGGGGIAHSLTHTAYMKRLDTRAHTSVNMQFFVWCIFLLFCHRRSIGSHSSRERGRLRAHLHPLRLFLLAPVLVGRFASYTRSHFGRSRIEINRSCFVHHSHSACNDGV